MDSREIIARAIHASWFDAHPHMKDFDEATHMERDRFFKQADAALDALTQAGKEIVDVQAVNDDTKPSELCAVYWDSKWCVGKYLDNSDTSVPWEGWVVPSMQPRPRAAKPTHIIPLSALPTPPKGEG